jgi:hypothetical protein
MLYNRAHTFAILAPEENSSKPVINTGLFPHSNESLGVGSQGATHPGC